MRAGIPRKVGPVRISDFEGKLRDGSVDPEAVHVWSKKMPDWVALREAASAEPFAALAAFFG